MTFKSLLASAALLASVSVMTPATANAADWSLSTDFVGEYVFRGFTLGAESIQPGVEVSFENGFTAGVWASTGVGEQSLFNADEVDFYAGYGFALSDTVSADIGATLYHYPQAGGVFDIGADEAGTFEVYGGLGFDMALAPSVYVYYDTTLEVFTLEGGAEYSVPVGESTSFDLSGTVGAVEPDEGDGYQYGQLGAALSYAFSDAASAYVGLTGVVASEDNFIDTDFTIDDLDAGREPGFDSNTVFYSIGFATGF